MNLPKVAEAPLAQRFRIDRRKVITRRWRKANMPGRLYWRDHNPGWRDWDTGEIACCKESVGGMKFYSLEAIEDFIEQVGD